ncbi:adenylosuccinate lyase [Rodentibacter trehalosifermentans]|uniref:Adenylosuccinate lyase n=1 Tax=Rodentibacter trehalosifermentans TaxID=1908263 RepID=A0A1V3IWA4_9PAST|nr:adenylosuccinate lyase family protein [Rodentibacter trehalosifermentans]OOF46216.1 adenylosuccinate lyase [Rodentibacter trehalosifermentans]
MQSHAISVFDSYMYSPLFAQTEMKEIWSEQSQIQCWLAFEKVIAKVQSELDIIPKEAQIAIWQACDNFVLDWKRLSDETESVGMPIKPLIDQISEQGGALVKQYLHWGCTTQDLLDTALAMRLKEALVILQNQLVMLGEALAEHAEEHRKTVMVARTNAVDASATTWGLQVSSYLNEINRHLKRLQELFPRAITGMFGGGVGNLASVGNKGMAVREKLCAELGLSEPCGLNNACQDHNVEIIQFFALIHGTTCRLANDVELMCRTPIFEASEGKKGGGSSTMPHKTNPRDCNMIQMLSRLGWGYANTAANLLDQQDVRSASMRMLNWKIIPEACMAVSTALFRALRLIKKLQVHPERMRANFNASCNFIMSEAVMMALAKKIGRQPAYKLIQQVLAHNQNNLMMAELLKQHTEIKQYLTDDEIDQACEPLNYLGCNDELITESIRYFRQLTQQE